jgi:hypothetical protein
MAQHDHDGAKTVDALLAGTIYMLDNDDVVKAVAIGGISALSSWDSVHRTTHSYSRHDSPTAAVAAIQLVVRQCKSVGVPSFCCSSLLHKLCMAGAD